MAGDIAGGIAGLLRQRTAQPVQNAGKRSDNLDIGGIDLVGVRNRVDMDHRRFNRPGFDQFHSIEADGQNHVRIFQERPDDLVAGHVEGSGKQGMVFTDGSLGHR